MYADEITGSMERAITETARRRKIQTEYNIKHNITPQTIKKDVRKVIEITSKENIEKKTSEKKMTKAQKEKLIEKLTAEMKKSAEMLEFEHASYLRDTIKALKGEK